MIVRDGGDHGGGYFAFCQLGGKKRGEPDKPQRGMNFNGQSGEQSLVRYPLSLDIYLCVRQTGTTELSSVNSDDVPTVGRSEAPGVSADGQFVAFNRIPPTLPPSSPGSSLLWQISLPTMNGLLPTSPLINQTPLVLSAAVLP